MASPAPSGDRPGLQQGKAQLFLRLSHQQGGCQPPAGHSHPPVEKRMGGGIAGGRRTAEEGRLHSAHQHQLQSQSREGVQGVPQKFPRGALVPFHGHSSRLSNQGYDTTFLP